jgi:hypothetical protein
MPRQLRSPITLTLSYFVSEIRSFWRNAMTFEVGVAEMPLRLRSSSGGEIFSNTDLINKVSTFELSQMRPGDRKSVYET